MTRIEIAETRGNEDVLRTQAHSRRQVLRLGGGGIIAGGMLAGGMQAPSAVTAAPPAIVGSWYVIRTAQSNQWPARWTMSLMADGTLVGQGIGGGQFPAGHPLGANIANGVWAQTGDGTFGFTYLELRSEAETGEPFALFKHFGDMTLDPGGDTFAITYYANPLDLDSLVQEQNRPVLQGKGIRIVLEPNRQ